MIKELIEIEESEEEILTRSPSLSLPLARSTGYNSGNISCNTKNSNFSR